MARCKDYPCCEHVIALAEMARRNEYRDKTMVTMNDDAGVLTPKYMPEDNDIKRTRQAIHDTTKCGHPDCADDPYHGTLTRGQKAALTRKKNATALRRRLGALKGWRKRNAKVMKKKKDEE